MKTFKYLYTFEDKWPEDTKWLSSFKSTRGYHDAAESICEEDHCNSAEYPDVDNVWLLSEGHDTPRRFRVYAETRRHYSASEIEE